MVGLDLLGRPDAQRLRRRAGGNPTADDFLTDSAGARAAEAARPHQRGLWGGHFSRSQLVGRLDERCGRSRACAALTALTYSGRVSTPVVITIHGFSSGRIVPAYERYDSTTTYVSISNADRHPNLRYAATIHHGVDAGW